MGRIPEVTHESCYVFWPLGRCGILIFFESWLRAVWVDFRSGGAGGGVDLSAILLQSLKVEQYDFMGKIAQGLGLFRDWLPPLSFCWEAQWTASSGSSGSLRVPLLRWKNNRALQVRYCNVYYFSVGPCRYLSICHYRWSKWWIQYIYYQITNRYRNRLCGHRQLKHSSNAQSTWPFVGFILEAWIADRRAANPGLQRA